MHGVLTYDISPIRGPLANAFVILINALFFSVTLIGLYDVYPRDYSQQLLNEEETLFDFVIVGAGAAGCAVANRLTEREEWSVLLIEAGDYPPPTTEVPGMYLTLIGSKEDWQFRMEKEAKACKAQSEERCILSKGKVLGGTSSINDMLYIHGLPEDYEKNNFGSWNANLTYTIFDKIEKYEKEDIYGHYGRTGLINLNIVNYTGTPKDILINCYKSTGYMSMSKRKYIGFREHLMMIKNGERFNMAKAFLTSIKERPNLFFTRNTEVEAIGVTEPVDKRANGVNVSIDGVKFFVRARKEVILTAGAINNAKLLLTSGIGPRKYFTDKNLPFVANLPGVGQNLRLHLTVPIYIAIDPSTVCEREYYKEADLIRDTFEYVIYRTGNFSHTNINEFVNYIFTKKIGANHPNLAIHHMYFKIDDRNLLAWMDAIRYHPTIVNSLLNNNKQRALILFLITLVDPLSTGEVLLNETHFLSNPMIKGNFMSDDEDVDYETLLSGFSYVTNLTEYMSKYHAEFLDLNIPNCRNFKFCSGAYAKCYIHNMAFPNSDTTGTTKMGPECDNNAVVKENLEVHKVRCLRVADSSVLNSITVGNTVASDAMIGFRLGEIIKEKWIKDYVSPYHVIDNGVLMS